MSDERINIIINEINYWKEHKLLPAVYCDYLLALYTKGDDTFESGNQNKNKIVKIIDAIRVILMFLMLLLSFILVYFIEMNHIWQTVLLIAMLTFSCWMYLFLRKTRNSSFHFAIVLLLTLFLLSSIHISTLYIKNQWVLYIILFFNFLIWWHMSQKQQLKYLKLISIIAIVFTMIYIFFHYFVS